MAEGVASGVNGSWTRIASVIGILAGIAAVSGFVYNIGFDNGSAGADRAADRSQAAERSAAELEQQVAEHSDDGAAAGRQSFRLENGTGLDVSSDESVRLSSSSAPAGVDLYMTYEMTKSHNQALYQVAGNLSEESCEEALDSDSIGVLRMDNVEVGQMYCFTADTGGLAGFEVTRVESKASPAAITIEYATFD